MTRYDSSRICFHSSRRSTRTLNAKLICSPALRRRRGAPACVAAARRRAGGARADRQSLDREADPARRHRDPAAARPRPAARTRRGSRSRDDRPSAACRRTFPPRCVGDRARRCSTEYRPFCDVVGCPPRRDRRRRHDRRSRRRPRSRPCVRRATGSSAPTPVLPRVS